MFIIKFTGGIGNQLFQYNFLLWLDKTYLHSDIRYDISEYKNVCDHGGFLLPITKFKRIKHYDKKKFRIVSDSDFQSSFSPDENIIFDGYWQKKQFLLDSLNVFTELFSDKKCTGQNSVYKNAIEKCENSVSVHIRRGDYENHFILGSIATKAYFTNAIERINKTVNNPAFFVFSDDTEWVKKNIDFYTDNVTYITGNTGKNVIYDIMLMSYCSRHVISNSSFSWWAQNIDTKPNKQVISPPYWVNVPCFSFVSPVADIQMPYFTLMPNIPQEQNACKEPDFSIVVAAYNLAHCIRRTLSTLLNQTYHNIEIIAVDDCSGDDTGRILDEYSNVNKKLHVIHHKKNQGVHCARKTGVQTAKGKYIILLDGDDYLEHTACEILWKKINKTDCDIYEYGFTVRPDNDVRLPIHDTRERLIALLDEHSAYSPTIWNKVYKASVLKQAFSYMDDFYSHGPEDVYESIVIAYFAHSYGIIEQPVHNYVTGNGISTKKQTLTTNIHYFALMQTVIEKTKLFLEKNKPEYVYKVESLEKHLVHDAVYWFINSLTVPEDIVPSLLALPAYFSTKALCPYFTELKENADNYRSGKINGHKICIYYIKKILPNRLYNKLRRIYSRLFCRG